MFCLGDPDAADVLVQVKKDLQGVSRSQVGKRRFSSPHSDTGLDLSSGGHVRVRAGHGKPLLQNFIGSQSKTELGRGTDDTGRTALEEGHETLILPDGCRAVAQAGVLDISFPGFDLQTCLDDIAGSGQVGRRHTGNGTGCEKLHDAQFVGGRFAKHVGFQMRIGGEINRGEWD